MNRADDRAWNGKSRGGRFGYLFFVYSIKRLGLGFAYSVLAAVVIYFIPFAPKSTAAVWSYCRRQRKLGRWRSVVELYRHYYVFGQTLIDRIALRAGLADRYHFVFCNYDRFLEIIDGRQGVVMIGAHVGCWEAGSVFFGKYGKKINIVMLDNEYRQIKEVLEESCENGGDFKIIAVDQEPLSLMLQIKETLDRGEYICFNGDRYINAKETFRTRFLGSPVLLPSGPFKIAAKCRVPVVFYYAMREKNRTYRFIFIEARVEHNKPAALLEQYTESLERLLEKYPRQWFNFYKFWTLSDKPDTEPGSPSYAETRKRA